MASAQRTLHLTSRARRFLSQCPGVRQPFIVEIRRVACVSLFFSNCPILSPFPQPYSSPAYFCASFLVWSLCAPFYLFLAFTALLSFLQYLLFHSSSLLIQLRCVDSALRVPSLILIFRHGKKWHWRILDKTTSLAPAHFTCRMMSWLGNQVAWLPSSRSPRRVRVRWRRMSWLGSTAWVQRTCASWVNWKRASSEAVSSVKAAGLIVTVSWPQLCRAALRAWRKPICLHRRLRPLPAPLRWSTDTNRETDWQLLSCTSRVFSHRCSKWHFYFVSMLCFRAAGTLTDYTL